MAEAVAVGDEFLDAPVDPMSRRKLFQRMDAAIAIAVAEILFMIQDTEPEAYQSFKYKLNSRIIERNRTALEGSGIKIHENNCEIVLT